MRRGEKYAYCITFFRHYTPFLSRQESWRHRVEDNQKEQQLKFTIASLTRAVCANEKDLKFAKSDS